MTLAIDNVLAGFDDNPYNPFPRILWSPSIIDRMNDTYYAFAGDYPDILRGTAINPNPVTLSDGLVSLALMAPSDLLLWPLVSFSEYLNKLSSQFFLQAINNLLQFLLLFFYAINYIAMLIARPFVSAALTLAVSPIVLVVHLVCKHMQTLRTKELDAAYQALTETDKQNKGVTRLMEKKSTKLIFEGNRFNPEDDHIIDKTNKTFSLIYNPEVNSINANDKTTRFFKAYAQCHPSFGKHLNRIETTPSN